MRRALVAAVTLVGLIVLAGSTGAVAGAGLPGPTGAVGPTGQGPTGPTGPGDMFGPTGSDGPTGDFGPTGVDGPTGSYGPTGCQGPCGPVGPTGPGDMFGPSGPGPGPIEWAGGGAVTDNTSDSYVAAGSFDISGAESAVEIPVPSDGTVSDLQVVVQTAPETGSSWTLTVDKNGTATALTCPIADLATTCTDSSLVAVAVGDKLDLDVTPFGSPALTTITWSAVVTP